MASRPSRGRLLPESGIRIVAILGALVALMAWTLASPPGASPDDDYHLASIWCAQGDRADRCEEVPDDPSMRLVPNEVNSVACFAFHNETSASCQNGFDGDLTPDSPRDHGNWNGGYPPLFYWTMSLFVTDSLNTSVLLMRTANIAIALGMVAALSLLLPRQLRHLLTVTLLVTSVPLTLFVVASTNPSAWTVISAATLWLALYAAFDAQGRRRVLLLAIAVLSTVLGTGSRADACLFVIASVAVTFVLRWRELRRQPLVTGVGVACAGIAGAVFLTAAQGDALSGGFGNAPATETSQLALLVTNLQRLPVLIYGSLGYGGMGGTGWLDTTFPDLVGGLTVAVWVAVVFTGWRFMSRPKALALIASGFGVVAYPLYMLGTSGATVGSFFQSRYLLPILILFTGISLLGNRRSEPGFNRFQAVMLVASLVTAHAVALYTQIRRYVTGFDVSGLDLDRGREWWWSLPLSATGTWLVGSVAFAVVAGLVLLAPASGARARARPILGERPVPDPRPAPETAAAPR